MSLGDFEKEYVGSVTDYLIAYKMVKDEYTEEELREVLNIFIENQEKDNTKQIVTVNILFLFSGFMLISPFKYSFIVV